MPTEVRNTDAKARVSLPKAFANATVIVEQLSDTEVRIRKAKVVAEDDVKFWEESIPPLSARDQELFLSALDNPPAPNKALRKLMQGRRSRHG